MKDIESIYKRKELVKLYLSSKYTQKEIAIKIGVSEQTIVKWVKEVPAIQYAKIRFHLAKELERLSRHPEGNEDMIFKYIDNIHKLDTMIRKAKFLPDI